MKKIMASILSLVMVVGLSSCAYDLVSTRNLKLASQVLPKSISPAFKGMAGGVAPASVAKGIDVVAGADGSYAFTKGDLEDKNATPEKVQDSDPYVKGTATKTQNGFEATAEIYNLKTKLELEDEVDDIEREFKFYYTGGVHLTQEFEKVSDEQTNCTFTLKNETVGDLDEFRLTLFESYENDKTDQEYEDLKTIDNKRMEFDVTISFSVNPKTKAKTNYKSNIVVNGMTYTEKSFKTNNKLYIDMEDLDDIFDCDLDSLCDLTKPFED